MSNNFCIGYDAEWQYPAITEQYSYNQVQKLNWDLDGVVYIGFPWATLIDTIDRKGEKAAYRLLDELKRLTSKISSETKVFTVCQHIRMLNYLNIFEDAGITHVFWSHAAKKCQKSENSSIKIMPFPLYPVQAINDVVKKDYKNKKYLFSFVGAKSNQGYLSSSRNMIIDQLKGNKLGKIISRDSWHYNKVVYDRQIENKVSTSAEDINNTYTKEYKKILEDSIFSLCPGGTGPNSIRLWEAIGYGSIPVILSDNYLPPGNIQLWKEACVFCRETIEDISKLPETLTDLRANSSLMEKKLKAVEQLWFLYGPDIFIYDLKKALLLNSQETLQQNEFDNQLTIFMKVNNITRDCLQNNYEKDWLNQFLTTCNSYILLKPEILKFFFKTNPGFSEVLKVALLRGQPQKTELLTKLLKIKAIKEI